MLSDTLSFATGRKANIHLFFLLCSSKGITLDMLQFWEKICQMFLSKAHLQCKQLFCSATSLQFPQTGSYTEQPVSPSPAKFSLLVVSPTLTPSSHRLAPCGGLQTVTAPAGIPPCCKSVCFPAYTHLLYYMENNINIFLPGINSVTYINTLQTEIFRTCIILL